MTLFFDAGMGRVETRDHIGSGAIGNLPADRGLV
jgi:GrpB-like predicted nucleotidyltransferase (UPF0157 family)